MLCLSSLPSDCHAAIVSFLPLESVINLGAASFTCLADIQPEISRRRKRFTQQFCYLSSSQSETGFYIPKAQLQLDLDLNPHFPPHSCNPSPGNLESLHLLPTVSDRINSLFQVLSTSHPSYDRVAELRSAICVINETDNDGESPPVAVDVDKLRKYERRIDSDFQSLLQAHVDNVRPHKLHALILREAIRSDPLTVNIGQAFAGVREGSLTVTLSRYIGDVLCAFDLLGHSDSGIIEASPDENEFKANLRSELCIHTEIAADGAASHSQVLAQEKIQISAYYRAWIFLHSTLLRIAPLSLQQLESIGIASPTPPRGETSSVNDATQVPPAPHYHSPFRANVKDNFWQQLSTAVSPPQGMECNFPPLRVTFSNFGPLGPAFRGRDMMESLMVQPVSVTTAVFIFDETDPSPSRETALVNNGQGVIQSLERLHEQSRRMRPMTVVPPLVSLRPVVHQGIMPQTYG